MNPEQNIQPGQAFLFPAVHTYQAPGIYYYGVKNDTKHWYQYQLLTLAHAIGYLFIRSNGSYLVPPCNIFRMFWVIGTHATHCQIAKETTNKTTQCRNRAYTIHRVEDEHASK